MIHNIIIIFNLFILESLLSVDNAAVLAIMVKDLPENQKPKALRYGLLGAYALRGLCLFVAAWLIKIVWLKIIGGAYLLYLVYDNFKKSDDEEESHPNSTIYNFASKIGLSRLWATIVLVEIMDLAFSIDNVFAAVALSSNLIIIMIGVFMGILAMRFVAAWFVTMLEKYPSLENSAFIVIALLGIKLILSGVVHYVPSMDNVNSILENHIFDLSFSGIMMLIFFVPLILNKLCPKK